MFLRVNVSDDKEELHSDNKLHVWPVNLDHLKARAGRGEEWEQNE